MSGSIGSRAWAAYAAALWALTFAVFHMIWACGWYIGLDAAEARVAFQKPLTLAYDLLVAVMCLVGAVVALVPVHPWGAWLRRRELRGIAWAGTGLLVLRAVAGAIQVGYFLAIGRVSLPDISPWDYWFTLGAILFGVSTWRYW